MSQPPPPPSQPPPGGYGVPQQPPGPPPYGYPQQPQGGGYGYPQQPPQGAPPGGYAAPPPGQPPYGQNPGMYPPGPYGQGFQGGPGKQPGGNGSRTVAIVAVVVAVVLVAGFGGWFLIGDDEPGDGGQASGKSGQDGKSTRAEQLIDVPAPKVSDDSRTVVGGWAVGDVFAKSSTGEIIGTSVTDGEQAWTIPLPGEVCSASQQKTEDDKVALVVKEKISARASCTRLVLVDLGKHKVEWDKPLPNAESASNDNVTISGDTVASAWIGGSAGYRISSGKQLWKAKDADCQDVGYAGGKNLMAVVECRDGADVEFAVQKLSPGGDAKSTFKVPRGVESVRVASTSPLVLVVGAGEESLSDVMTVGKDNKLAARIPLGERYNKPCGIEVESCYGMAVSEDAVHLSTVERTGADYGLTNEVMAFDFQTGKTKWKSEGGEKHRIVPFKVEDGKVLGYKLPGYDTGGEVVSIAPGSGEQTSLLKMPKSEPGKGEQAFSMATYSVRQPIIFENDRLFLQESLVSKPTAGESAKRLAVGFGAK